MKWFKYAAFMFSGKGVEMFKKWNTERERAGLGLDIVGRLEMIASARLRIDTLPDNGQEKAILRMSLKNGNAPFDIELLHKAFRLSDFN